MEAMRRPKAEVLPDNATIPGKNLLVPPPNHFTHELTRSEPYYYGEPQEAQAPDGEFAAGTQVLMVLDAGDYCRVADARGLYVAIVGDSLRKLED